MAHQTKRTVTAKPGASCPYEQDVYGWIQEQISFLEAGQLDRIDAANIAEELRDVGNEQRFKLESAIAVLTQHLLKWDYQPDRRSRSWELSIAEQRRRIGTILKRNPSLKPSLQESIDLGYADGRGRALDETGLAKAEIPDVCPYTFDDMMTRVIEFEP